MSTDSDFVQHPVQPPEVREPEQRQLPRVTRGSIGEAVITTDAAGRVTFLNSLAESLTGCTLEEAKGQPWAAILRIVNEESQRRLEQALADARAYADDIVATVREPLVVLDAELRVRMANRSFYQEFGVSPADTEGRFLHDLGDGQWRIPALRTMLEEILLQNTSFHDFEVEGTFPVLGRRTMLLNARRLLGEGDHRGLILLAIEDITERKLAARAVATSEIRYRRLFETAQDAILILDADTGKIMDSNPFLSALLGYSADELLGKELWEIGLFKDIKANRAAFRQLQERGYIRYEDLPLETKDGRDASVEFVSNVYPVEGHQVIQCNIRDISDRKRAEEALREADRRKDEFLAMLAHELRNPLAPIRSAVQVMRTKSSDDASVQWAREVVERQVQHLARLVDDLLDVSRISQGKITLQLQPVDLAIVVARAVEISRPLIDARKHQLQLALPEIPVRVEADSTRLAQVVSNLLNNAAKYTEEGGRIELIVEQSGEEAVVRVRDTGVGIAADMLASIFDLFTQVRGSVSRSQGGLGIGLALVRSLVRMHGGSVEATSGGLGQGSEFVVRLPLVAEPLAPAAVLPLALERPTQAPPQLILVVDDNGDAAEMLAMLLRFKGHEVRTAHDGLAALDAVRAQPPDVVLCDIGMPGMDGLEVARRLRLDLGLKQALLVALTGYGGEDDRRRSREAGFNAHLVKPVDVRDLEPLLSVRR